MEFEKCAFKTWTFGTFKYVESVFVDWLDIS